MSVISMSAMLPSVILTSVLLIEWMFYLGFVIGSRIRLNSIRAADTPRFQGNKAMMSRAVPHSKSATRLI